MSLLQSIHGGYVHPHRVQVLGRHLAQFVPPGPARVLDVGCGDGRLAALLKALRPELDVEGIDVLVRPGAQIPIRQFDGRSIPFPDGSIEVITFVDVLHHTEHPRALLQEAARVARRAVVIKDHLRQGYLAGPTLRFMDRVGNARHGVALPYNYQSPDQWSAHFAAVGLRVSQQRTRLGLYPWWAGWAFERQLHVLARLEPIG